MYVVPPESWTLRVSMPDGMYNHVVMVAMSESFPSQWILIHILISEYVTKYRPTAEYIYTSYLAVQSPPHRYNISHTVEIYGYTQVAQFTGGDSTRP
jgi:hypothetical protein